MEVTVRRIHGDELEGLLELYRYLQPEDPELERDESLGLLWEELCAREDQEILVAVTAEGRLAASCVLTVIPNLTRRARPYGLIENVVTHPDYRRRGLATKVLLSAVAKAKERNAYKVMLMTSSKEEGTLRFYEQAGFRRDLKTAFITKLE